jgi:signal transduction histidine kinase
VNADIGLVERVLENLIGNALRHTPTGGEIKVALSIKDTEVEIEVHDNGIGIPQSELQNIFDRFYQVDNMERNSHHAGLGLSIAQHIVAMHGGKIRVVSEPGLGSSFFFSLPVWIKENEEIIS